MIGHRSNPQRLWQSVLLFGAAFYACAKAGSMLSVPGSWFVNFWLPAGLYVGVLLVNETRSWPWFMLAAAAANFLFDVPIGTPLATTLGFYSANTIEALVGAWLVRRFVAEQPSLTTVKEFLALLVYSALLSTLVGAAIGAATLVASGRSESFWKSGLSWWCNNALAIMLVTPLILVWSSKPDSDTQFFNRRGKLLEAALLTALVVGLTWYMMVEGKGINASNTSLLMPMLLWAGFRFGLRGATAVTLLLALLMVYFTTHFQKGLTPADLSSGNYIITLQCILMVSVFMAMVPAIVIADRNQKVLELQSSEDRFRQFTQAAFEGVCISENGRIIDINDQGLKMFGYERGEMTGKAIVDVVAPEFRAMVVEAIRTEQEVPYGHRLLRKDGSVFYAEARAKMVRVGHRTLRMTALRDITERMVAEEALREASQFNRQIIGSTNEGIVVFDRDLRYQVWNPFMEQLTGVPAAQVLGRRMEEVFPFLQETEMVTLLKKGLDGEISRPLDFPFQIPETNHRGWTSRIICPLRNSKGEVIGVISSVRDITERKQSEDHLRESEERFRRAFEDAPIGLALVSLEGRWLRVNRSLCEMVGYPESELLAADFQNITHPDDLQASLNLAHDLLDGRVRDCKMEKRYFHKLGQIVNVHLSVSLVREADGKPLYFISQILDITERKQTEAKLAAQALALKRSNLELEQFAYVASHDLQEPLRAISGFAQILKRHAGGKLDPEANTMIGHIVEGAKRMSDIIQDFLSLSRMGARGQTFETIAIEKSLALALSNLSVVIRERQAVIRQDALPTLLVDASQLALLFQNLVGNAIKFCRDRAPEIHIGATTDGAGFWTVFVRDNGIGIDAKYFDRIFGIFQRLHTRDEYPGTGIGLAICKKIAERHGGRIWLESAPGNGTTFYFTLPERQKENNHGTSVSRGING